jgi:hypothetical protein
MNSKSSCNQVRQPPAIERLATLTFLFFVVCILASAPCARAGGDAPAWMHALVNVPLPAHDEKTDAVLLYSEDVLTVQLDGKIKSLERRAYKILRPDGRHYGRVAYYYDSQTRITGMHAWCIPAQGKDYEVKEKEALEEDPYAIPGIILVVDQHRKIMNIPASDPGNVVGYEVEHEDRPYLLQDQWIFQHVVPTREARYTLQLPAGWEYKAVWMNHPIVQPSPSGNNQWQWVVTDVQGVRPEENMPPWDGIAAQMFVSFLPPGGSAQNKGLESWRELGYWEQRLIQGRRDPSPQIKQKVAELTASSPSKLEKMQTLAKFLQREIRYLAIELGIGGWQPHPAVEIFSHRYGDCKDKATLLGSMFSEIGIDSYYVTINTERGSVSDATPASPFLFNHVILAVRLPEEVKDASLVAVINHPKLGRLLFFDPTDEMTPFGQLRGPLQANYGLLVTPDGGELVELPQEPSAMNSIRRNAKLTLDSFGTLKGDVKEIREGDRAWSPRFALQSSTRAEDRAKFIEAILNQSLATYQLTHAAVTNLTHTELPFECDYSLVAANYAKMAGNLLLVRPRVIGSKTSGILETKEPRHFPVEFEGPARDTDIFEITLPAGYEVDDLPPPVNADYSFASYHSKTEVSGNVLRYTRTFELKELSVPLSKVQDLKLFYRIIATDERNTAVLKPAAH